MRTADEDKRVEEAEARGRRKERAAIVAWLQQRDTQLMKQAQKDTREEMCIHRTGMAAGYREAALCVEAGDHHE